MDTLSYFIFLRHSYLLSLPGRYVSRMSGTFQPGGGVCSKVHISVFYPYVCLVWFCMVYRLCVGCIVVFSSVLRSYCPVFVTVRQCPSASEREYWLCELFYIYESIDWLIVPFSPFPASLHTPLLNHIPLRIVIDASHR